VRDALAMIEARIGSGGLGAGELAARIGYSSQHFGRLFRGLTGESPADYILKRRLTEAARRLVMQGGAAAEVARAMGWEDYETFSRAFKRHFGLAPSRIFPS